MKKITATLIKEWILLRRDVAGFLLLFIMPAILIVVMALVQDAPFRDYQEMRFDLLLADNDKGSLATEIKDGLKQSRNFNVIDEIDGKPLTEETLKELLKNGDYKVGIVIPAGATAEVVNSANIVANDVSKRLGLGTMPAREPRDNKYVRMYFDPASKPTFRTSISFALDKYITYSCSNLLVQRMSRLSKTAEDTASAQNFKKIFAGIGIKEEILNDKGYKTSINSVQHNVPAWAIFGIFFVVIPICGQIIRERTEGSALRIQLIPGAFTMVTIGKIVFYTLLGTLQFVVMFCIGIWILPLLGLPTLYLGAQPVLLIPVALAISFAATSYGYFVGTIFKTTNQALPFGSISVVILSAIGGIWVPVDLLPSLLQTLAKVSPLHWGLDAVHQLILRNGNIYDIAGDIIILICFSTLLSGISILINKKRNHSI